MIFFYQKIGFGISYKLSHKERRQFAQNIKMHFLGKIKKKKNILTLVLLNLDMSCLCKQCRDQLASKEANWSGSALFAIKYANLYQQSGSRNVIGWKSELGSDWLKIRNERGILIYSAWQGLKRKLKFLQKLFIRSFMDKKENYFLEGQVHFE